MSETYGTKKILKEGEDYAGIILGKDSALDHHLILLPGEAEKVTWPEAKEWANKAGGSLPTRRELALLYVNLRKRFEPACYWSCEQHPAYSDWASYQSFFDARQSISIHFRHLRACAVRRVTISGGVK